MKGVKGGGNKEMKELAVQREQSVMSSALTGPVEDCRGKSRTNRTYHCHSRLWNEADWIPRNSSHLITKTVVLID